MLVELAWFAAGCVAGGYFVYRGMRGAMMKELQKRPWTEEEKEERAQMLAEAARLSMQKDDPDAIQRSKELRQRGIDARLLGRLVTLTGTAVISAMIIAAPSWAARIKHARALFAGLDKITGRTIAFEAAAGETVQFGTLQITERACFTRPATETPQTVTFVEVDEVGAGKEYKRIFSGWMFAASPGLHGIEHPIYDVWLTDCEGEGVAEAGLEIPESAMPAETKPAAPESIPAPPPKSSRRSRRAQPSEYPSPESGVETGEMPQEQSPEAELPPLGQPVEVGPPPGFIPVPQGDRHRKPIEQYDPDDPDAAPDASGGDGF